MSNKYYDIPNFEGYKINKNGDVFSCLSNKKLKPIEDGRGYILYILYANNKRITIGLYRLLCITFKPNLDKTKTEVDHINGNRSDNRLENLEWVSHRENVRRYHNKKNTLEHRPVVLLHGDTKVLKEFSSHYEVAKYLNLHRYEILRRIKCGEKHMHIDYTFIKWKDNPNPFPKITYAEEYRKLSSRTNEIKMYNHLTGDIKIFTKMKLAAKFLNISPSTLTWRIKARKNKVFPNGWEAKFSYDNTPWQRLSQSDKLRLASGGISRRPIALIHHITGETLKFKTVKEAADYLKRGSALVCYRLLNNRTKPATDGYCYLYLDE